MHACFRLLAIGLALAAQHSSMHDMKTRGAEAMGFDQDKTIHHFRITPDGGTIDVRVKDPSDAASLTSVRSHLQEIAKSFARGRFDKPFVTHGEVPPGVPTLQKRKSSVRYRYEDLADGGRVVISSSDRTARAAVHEFLRYQIREHGTGDPPLDSPT